MAVDQYGNQVQDFTSTFNGDAWAYLDSMLSDLGLSSLSGNVKGYLESGYSQNEILQRLRQTPEYKQRFRANEIRKEKGLPPLSEAEIISTERQYRQLMRSAGLPQGFYDQSDDFAELLAGDVSPSELNSRINDGYVAASMAPPEVRQKMEEWFGAGQSNLAAYFLDPDKALPVLQQQLASAQIGSQALRTGYGDISAQDAMGLSSLGVSQDAAQRGFTQLASSKELFTALPGQENGEDNITQQEQLGAAFGGNANAQERIRRRAEKRKAEFGAGGGFAQSKTGQTGLGTAS